MTATTLPIQSDIAAGAAPVVLAQTADWVPQHVYETLPCCEEALRIGRSTAEAKLRLMEQELDRYAA